jgi:hypothetical protein
MKRGQKGSIPGRNETTAEQTEMRVCGMKRKIGIYIAESLLKFVTAFSQTGISLLSTVK